MAKAASIVHISGTIGDLTFYKRRGKFLTRKKSSLDGERVRTDPAFAPSQVRAAEYGGASTIASQLRKGLGPLQHLFLAGRFHTKIVGAVRKGFMQGDTQNGPADFSIALAEEFISRLNFSASTKPCDIAACQPLIQSDSNKAGLVISVGEPSAALPPVDLPKGATHYAFILHIQPFTDYKYDQRSSRYKPAVTTKAETITQRFDWSPVPDTRISSNQKQAEIMTPFTINLGKPKKGVTHLLWWGILFSQKVGDNYVALRLGTNMKLWTTFPANSPTKMIHQKSRQETLTPQVRQLHDLLGISSIT